MYMYIYMCIYIYVCIDVSCISHVVHYIIYLHKCLFIYIEFIPNPRALSLYIYSVYIYI